MKIYALLAALVLAGCAGMSESMQRSVGVGEVSTSTSSFDGKSEVVMQPAWVADADGGMPQFKLGFFWTENVPDTVVVLASVASLDDYSLIEGLALNLDGEIIDLQALDALTDLDHDRLIRVTCNRYGCNEGMVLRTSEKRYLAPLSVVRRLAESSNAKVKLSFAKTYTVGNFSAKSSGNVTAAQSLPDFLQSVDLAD